MSRKKIDIPIEEFAEVELISALNRAWEVLGYDRTFKMISDSVDEAIEKEVK